MREILFRGKRLDNREWAYGYLVQAVKSTKFWIDCSASDGIVAIHFVEPSTVGQYTGLTDKNGVKIFEGDILRFSTGTLHEVVFEQRNGHAYFGWVVNGLETWNFDCDFLRKLEVIGNIHDNPELLKGGDEG